VQRLNEGGRSVHCGAKPLKTSCLSALALHNSPFLVRSVAITTARRDNAPSFVCPGALLLWTAQFHGASDACPVARYNFEEQRAPTMILLFLTALALAWPTYGLSLAAYLRFVRLQAVLRAGPGNLNSPMGGLPAQ
jgi:uncharacterized iron-regulated membrane protein